MNTTDDAPGILNAIAVLRERWWVVLLAAAVCAGGSIAITVTSVKQYSATAKLLFQDSGVQEALGGAAPPASSDPQADQATNTELVTTNAVAQQVKTALKLPDSTDTLIGEMSVTNESSGNLVDVTATDVDPIRAARLATAFAQQYVLYSKNRILDQLAEGERLIDQKIARLDPSDKEGRASLEAAKRKAVLAEAGTTGNAQVIDTAEVPGSPSSPNPKRNVAIALFFGLLLGAGIAFLLNVIDRRIKEVEDFERLYGLRALAAVPEQRDRDELRTELEPFRILRGGLALLAEPHDPIQTVLITSAVPGEGKTTIAAGLATALALAGHAVVLVEADLRRPTLSRQFDLGAGQQGLTTALVGGVDPVSLLRRPQSTLRNLEVLASGPLLPASSELLRSEEMAHVLEELRGHADYVILDAPPLLPVADARVLLSHPQVDACVVVCRAYHTTRDEVRSARAILDRAHVPRSGLVVNGLRQAQAAYDYGPRPAAGAASRR